MQTEKRQYTPPGLIERPVTPPAKRRILYKIVPTVLIFLLWDRYLKAPASTDVPTTPRTDQQCSAQGVKDEFNWYDLTPSEDIQWTDCFDGQKCARLSLPLDYLTPEGPKTDIALRMIPASSKTQHSGTILVNPGGPGGSGTDLIARKGEQLSTIAGPTFDILGFDPRGTGASTPSAQCFNSSSQYKIWALGEKPLVNISDDSVIIQLARSEAEGELCLKALGGNEKDDLNGTAEEWGIGRFMSTTSVATDMLKISEKLGQDKIKYWGFSYGTVLGQFFAAMYPDKISRLVIDGVAEGYDYRNVSWAENLHDMDKVLDSFFTFCHEAGPEKCAFHSPTVSGIEDRVLNIFAALRASPIPVPFTKSSSGPVILTADMLTNKVFMAAYAPLVAYPILARSLLAIESGNQSAIQEFVDDATFACSCDGGETIPPWRAENKAWAGIACGDGPAKEYDEEAFEDYYNTLYNQSSLAGPVWATSYLSCAGWKMEAKWRYMGPLSAENTSHPILVTNPLYDPVTPARNAKTVYKRYGGAGLLLQHSYGHCTLSAPSLCKAKAVRDYFVNGTLPEEGIICEAEEMPFIGKVNNNMKELNIEDEELLNALRDLSEERFSMNGRF